MKKTKLLFAVGVGMLSGIGAMAQSTDLYSSHEGSVDFFGFYGSRDKGGNRDAWGMGAGFNYFFTQYLGVGADTYMDAFTVPYLLNGQGIFRYPIKGTAIAPYAFGGFGRQWTHAAQWLGDIGVGAEYRFQPCMGAFFDAREVFPTETRDYAVLRFGFRFSFR
jgi:hypothetical protein